MVNVSLEIQRKMGTQIADPVPQGFSGDVELSGESRLVSGAAEG